jgi:hypothetical protein
MKRTIIAAGLITVFGIYEANAQDIDHSVEVRAQIDASCTFGDVTVMNGPSGGFDSTNIGNESSTFYVSSVSGEIQFTYGSLLFNDASCNVPSEVSIDRVGFLVNEDTNPQSNGFDLDIPYVVNFRWGGSEFALLAGESTATPVQYVPTKGAIELEVSVDPGTATFAAGDYLDTVQLQVGPAG